jgi:hypothetical protein
MRGIGARIAVVIADPVEIPTIAQVARTTIQGSERTFLC